MFAEIADRIIENASQLANHLTEIQALGISGSGARGGMDAFSDVDICVFVEGEYPRPKVRQEAYTAIGFADSIYFDVDFCTSRGDGFTTEGLRCDFTGSFGWHFVGRVVMAEYKSQKVHEEEMEWMRLQSRFEVQEALQKDQA